MENHKNPTLRSRSKSWVSNHLIFYLSASTNKLRRAIRDINSSSREEIGGIRRSASARGCSQAVSCLSDVMYAVIVVLRRRVGLEVVFDESLVFGVQRVDVRHSRLTTTSTTVLCGLLGMT